MPDIGQFFVRELGSYADVFKDLSIRRFVGFGIGFFVYRGARDLQHVADDICKRLGREALFQGLLVPGGNESVQEAFAPVRHGYGALLRIFGVGMDDEQLESMVDGQRLFVYSGYGMFGQMPGNVLLAFELGTKALGRPVKWISDRSEAILSDCAGRDNVTRLTMGFDAENRITAFKTEALSNLGGHNSPFGVIMQSQLYSRVLTGVYDIQTVWMETRGVYTNTIPTL